eukprot:15448250-Alexandrium_andersonii.AAC.1
MPVSLHIPLSGNRVERLIRQQWVIRACSKICGPNSGGGRSMQSSSYKASSEGFGDILRAGPDGGCETGWRVPGAFLGGFCRAEPTWDDVTTKFA